MQLGYYVQVSNHVVIPYRGFRDRLLADPSFFVKLGIEVTSAEKKDEELQCKYKMDHS